MKEHKKVLIIDAIMSSGRDRASNRGSNDVIQILQNSFQKRGWEFNHVGVFEKEIKNCLGCGKCSLETPGSCVIKDDMDEILAKFVKSDCIVYLTPIRFGAPHWRLKKVVDRFLPLSFPRYTIRDGELHHSMRYPGRPIIAGIGILPTHDKDSFGSDKNTESLIEDRREEESIFYSFLYRNRINLDAPGWTGTMMDENASPEGLEKNLKVFLDSIEQGGIQKTQNKILPGAKSGSGKTRGGFRVSEKSGSENSKHLSPVSSITLLSGSTRGRKTTSESMLNYLAEIFPGTTSEVFRAYQVEKDPERLASLATSIQQSDLLLIIAPLYVDAPPASLLKVLHELVEHQSEKLRGKGIFGIIHSGYMKPSHRAVSLSILHQFSRTAGMNWYGGMGFGGTSPVAGEPLQEAFFTKNLRTCLEALTETFAEGNPLSDKFYSISDKKPVPIPLSLIPPILNARLRKQLPPTEKKEVSRPYFEKSGTSGEPV